MKLAYLKLGVGETPEQWRKIFGGGAVPHHANIFVL